MIKKHSNSVRANLDTRVSNYIINESDLYYCLHRPIVYSCFEKGEIIPKYGNIARYYKSLRELTYDVVDFNSYANSLYFNPKHNQSRKWWFR